MEVYLNKNFTPATLKQMKKDLTIKSVTRSGMRRTHTIPNLIREMDELGIRKSVSLPIDYPVLSSNGVDTLRAVQGNDRFITFGTVHPYASDVEAKLDRQVALGAKGVKVHPAVQLISPSNHRAMKLYRLCAARKLPVLFHCGPVGIEPKMGRKLSQVVLYEKAIAENGDVVFILGHSGALQMEKALEYAKRYSNVFLDLSCQSLTNVRTILDQGPPDRLLYGTDWPFYHQAIALAKVLLATEGDRELRGKALYGNAARLFGLS
jgi:predicted TIM-barrel fold metal-dependent hydrolase